MVANVHRQNSNFQLRYFIAGQCHTADGAWAALYNQKIDIEGKLEHVEAQRLRREAAIARSQAVIDDPNITESERLDAQADKIEQQADVSTWKSNVQGARDELDAIIQLMEELEPYRKYSGHDPLKAAELSQHDEWREELKSRAENFLAANTLGIPWDHLQTMRSHPDFHDQILPHLLEVGSNLNNAFQKNNPQQKQISRALSKPPLFPSESE